MGKSLTQEEFIEKAIEKHGNKYDYSQVNYINTRTKVKIFCKHHEYFIQTPANHLAGNQCPECSKKQKIEKITSNTEKFIKKGQTVHNNLYNYDKVTYVHSEKRVIITCPIHGDFQQKPYHHINGAGCQKCARQIADFSKIKTIETLLQQVKEIHGDLYDYSETVYVNSKIKINIGCRIHGNFEQMAGDHLKGSGCPKCKIKTQEKYIQEATEKHKGLYSYENTIYIRSKDKIIITCKEHGNFEQQASSHLFGTGCPKCGFGFGCSRSGFIKKAGDKVCTFYIIRCFNESEEFYKIGITSNTISWRYRQLPYEYEIISEIRGSAGFVWDTEKGRKKELKNFHYQPNTNFDGSLTECFTNYKIEDEK